MIHVNSLRDITPDKVGMYIRLGGNGIMDGLAGAPCKRWVHLLTEVNGVTICVREYRRRHWGQVGAWAMDQEAELYTPAEWRAMPEYCSRDNLDAVWAGVRAPAT
jgi:hypothetical protein